VVVFVVGGAGFPQFEDDADPFVGQGADGGVVSEASGAFYFVEGFGPASPFAVLVGELVKGLPEDLRAGVAAGDAARLSALTGDRRDSALALNLLSRVVTVAIGTEGDDQPWDEGVSGSGQRAEKGPVGVPGNQLGNLFVELADALIEMLDQFGQRLSRAAVRWRWRENSWSTSGKYCLSVFVSCWAFRLRSSTIFRRSSTSRDSFRVATSSGRQGRNCPA